MLTNRYNVPPPWPSIILEGGHEPNPNRYSVTDLLGPPLIRTLKIQHYGELASDVSDYLWMLNGTALDQLFSTALAKQPGWITQYKMELPIEGVTVVGVADGVKDDLIVDLKATSVYTLGNAERLAEYEKQVNLYAYMKTLERGVPVRRLEIHAFLRDWVATKARWDKDYPKCQIQVLKMHCLTHEQQEAFLYERLLDHLRTPDRPCTPEEKWQKPTQYAIMKKGRKSALRVLDTQVDAEQWIAEKNPGKVEIVERPGSCMRCDSYCNVSSKCPYYSGGSNE